MSLEIRPYREEESAAFYRVPGIVFGGYTGTDERRGPGIAPEWTLCAFEDGELATTYAAYPFVMRLNGGKAPAAGVTYVGTLPWFRRRGHLRKIMEADFQRRYEERREPIAILLASIAAIYQRYGYAVCSARQHYAIDPRWINVAPTVAEAPGAFREGKPDELPLLQQIYREFSGPRNGYLHRAPIIWEGQVLVRGEGVPPDGAGNDAGPSLIAIYEEDGQAKGYVTWAAKWFPNHFLDDAGGGQRVFVRDFAYTSFGAYRAMWDMFRRFDLAVRVHVEKAPVDDPAFDILLDPRELHAKKYDWVLARLIDVERALPLRPYGREGRVVFELADDMCAWNRGRWALDAGPEGSAITRVTETPHLTLDVSALAQLVFGMVAPSRAVRIGRAEAAPDAPLRLWDEMFRTEYAPFCPDGF